MNVPASPSLSSLDEGCCLWLIMAAAKKYGEGSAFSQSLKGVNWRFLREVPAEPTEPFWASGNNGGSSLSPPNAVTHGTTFRGSPRGSFPSGFANDEDAENYNKQRMERVRQLESALTQSEFPSQILKYLAISEEDETDRLMELSEEKSRQWGREDMSSSALQAKHQTDLQQEIEQRTNVDHLFDDDDLAYPGAIDETKMELNGEQREEREVGVYSEDDGSDFESDHSRSPSPIIIWRPAARVKVATDVPPELLEDLLEDDDSEDEVPQAAKRNSFIKKPIPQQEAAKKAVLKKSKRLSTFTSSHKTKENPKRPKPVKKKTDGTRRPDVHRPLTDAEKRKKKGIDLKRNYGAWYIKPELWKDCAEGKGEKVLKTREATTSETEKMRQEMTKELDNNAKELEKKIPKLFITDQYRKYLMAQNKHAHSEALPLPHYLQYNEDAAEAKIAAASKTSRNRGAYKQNAPSKKNTTDRRKKK